jgi:RNA polymerase sigma factor (sigma-70 family)
LRFDEERACAQASTQADVEPISKHIGGQGGQPAMEPDDLHVHAGESQQDQSPTRAAAADADFGVPDTDSPVFYLRELRDRCPLDLNRELRYARDIKRSRGALAELIPQLPPDCRERVTTGGLGPRRGSRWPLEHLETCCERLSRYQRGRSDPQLVRLSRRIEAHKRRLDRARDALVLANLRFVPHVAKRFKKCGLPFMDLVQEGNLGLMKAVDRFELERGFRFCTYAFWWIRQSITKAIVDKARLIRLPAQIGASLNQLRRASDELRESLGRKPTPGELATRLRLPEDKVDELLVVVRDTRSLEDVGGSGRQCVAASSPATPLDTALDREVKREVGSALGELGPREEEIIRLRFGIGRERGHTLREIGQIFGISRERIRRIERVDASLVARRAGGTARSSPRPESHRPILARWWSVAGCVKSVARRPSP